MCTSIIYLNVKEKKFFQKATGDITGVNVAIAFLCLLNKPVFLELKFKMIVLPYTGLNISMGLILPEEGTTASQILVSLASNGYNKNFVYFVIIFTDNSIIYQSCVHERFCDISDKFV